MKTPTVTPSVALPMENSALTLSCNCAVGEDYAGDDCTNDGTLTYAWYKDGSEQTSQVRLFNGGKI